MSDPIKRLDVVALAYAQVGVPYIYGGNGPLYYDCSGLLCFVYRKFGLMPDRDLSSQMLFDWFTGRDVKAGDAILIPGDGIDCSVTNYDPANAIFFGKNADAIRHCGLIVDKTWMVEAARGNARTRTIGDAIAQSAKVGCNPVKRRSDRVGIVDPTLKTRG